MVEGIQMKLNFVHFMQLTDGSLMRQIFTSICKSKTINYIIIKTHIVVNKMN